MGELNGKLMTETSHLPALKRLKQDLSNIRHRPSIPLSLSRIKSVKFNLRILPTKNAVDTPAPSSSEFEMCEVCSFRDYFIAVFRNPTS